MSKIAHVVGHCEYVEYMIDNMVYSELTGEILKGTYGEPIYKFRKFTDIDGNIWSEYVQVAIITLRPLFFLGLRSGTQIKGWRKDDLLEDSKGYDYVTGKYRIPEM